MQHCSTCVLRRALCQVRTGYGASRRTFSGRSLTRARLAQGSTESTIEIEQLQTLAIETSCDDTSVAVLSIKKDHQGSRFRSDVLFHERITSNSEGYGGIHPLVALHSHERELGPLIQRAVQHLQPRLTCTGRGSGLASVESIEGDGPRSWRLRRIPDFVSVTRGPGMRSNLSVGLDTAKGLAIAWNVPLVGVHHMQAHALTSRLCATLPLTKSVDSASDSQLDARDGLGETVLWTPSDLEPRFPFLTVLASGGHTMLIDSSSLTDHKILAETGDIALGDCLDKAARAILPTSQLKVPYGKALEDFAFPDRNYDYKAPVSRREELQRRTNRWGWSLGPPLAEDKGEAKSNKRMIYSFAGLLSSIQRFVSRRDPHASSDDSLNGKDREISQEERREMAREVQRVAFEHLTSRILLHLSSLAPSEAERLGTIVVSGGVAANGFLRHVLRAMLDVRGYQSIKLCFPPPELCTDNALMIAWAGIEMYDAGYCHELSIQPLRKWSMSDAADDGGILGAHGLRRTTQVD